MSKLKTRLSERILELEHQLEIETAELGRYHIINVRMEDELTRLREQLGRVKH